MRRLLAWYTNASLRRKFALHAAFTTTFTFAILLPFVLYTQRQVVLAEVEDAGLRMAEIFARSGVQAVAANDYLMMQFVVNGVAGGTRVVSAMLLQEDGTVLVHSKASERGKRYTDERSLAAARTEAPLIQRYQLAAGPFVYDFALPVYVLADRRASARVVVSIERELAAIARTRNSMILLGLAVLGFGFAWATYQAERVTRPIRALVHGTVEITRHNLDNRIPVTSRDELGQLAGAFNTMTDDLKTARTDLIEKTRLAAMGEVAAVVAHETRNPLGALSNCVQLLGKRPQTFGDDAEILEIMQSEVERLNGIVSDFLAFGRPRRPRLQEFELHELLDGALAALGRDRRCSASIALVRTFDPGLGVLSADQDQLRQVFWNLFLNAVQAMGEKGTLTVETRRQGHHAEIIVRDTGLGIPRETLSRLFTPFYTTKPAGTGLGLPIVRRLVEDHGGRVAVDSEEGVGTSVIVSLPITAVPRSEHGG